MALRLVCCFLLLLLACVNGQKPLRLSDHNFEHDTQAATGQTTGSWLVLFTGPNSESKLAEEAVSKVLAGLEGQPLLVAKVDLTESPKTAKRFSLTAPPYIKLFRNRRVFAYKGDWSASSISEFAEKGWEDIQSEMVPPEAGFMVELFEVALVFAREWAVELVTFSVTLVALLSYGAYKAKAKSS